MSDLDFRRELWVRFGGSRLDDRQEATTWIESCVRDHGIEGQISAIIKVLAILTTKHLEGHPGDLERIADSIGCDNWDRTLVDFFSCRCDSEPDAARQAERLKAEGWDVAVYGEPGFRVYVDAFRDRG